MVLSCTSESWTCGLWLNVARGRTGERQGGCRLWEARPTLRLKLLSPPLHLLPLYSAVSYADYHYLNSHYRRFLSVFLCPFFVLFVYVHPQRRNNLFPMNISCTRWYYFLFIRAKIAAHLCINTKIAFHRPYSHGGHFAFMSSSEWERGGKES